MTTRKPVKVEVVPTGVGQWALAGEAEAVGHGSEGGAGGGVTDGKAKIRTNKKRKTT